MGVGASIPDREQFKKQTFDGVRVSQRFLQMMLEQSDLLDMYSLADPAECKKYVVVTAGTLEKVFKELRIEIKRDQKGRDVGQFYFQKLSALARLPDERIQKDNCTLVAFFYIRILHIFAALTLSVINTEIPSQDTNLEVKPTDSLRDRERRRFSTVPSYYPNGPTFGGAIGQGQEARIRTEPYAILNPYVTYDKNKTKYKLDNTDSIYLRVPYTERGATLYDRNVYIDYKTEENDEKIYIKATLTITRNNNIYEVLLSDIRRGRTDSGGSLIMIPSDSKTIRRELGKVGPVNFELSQGEPKFNNQTIARFIIKEIYKAAGKDIINSRYNNITGTGQYATETRRKRSKNLPSGIPDTFKVKQTVESLELLPRPYAHCVARAFEVLSPQSFYGDLGDGFVTSICDPKFSLRESGSLPASGQDIFTSRSLLSVQRLFFDMLETNMKKMKDETKEKYEVFMRSMKEVFEEGTEEIKGEAVSILNQRPVFCRGDMAGKLQFSGSQESVQLGTKLRGTVGALLQRQMNHTYSAVTIIKKLFDVGEDKRLTVKKSIIKLGMPEVEKIAQEARDLLSKYISDCEHTYREGVTDMRRLIQENPELLKSAKVKKGANWVAPAAAAVVAAAAPLNT